jgi:CelD/BcsL family acetyltransferase involved in cellulose biosynthesis
MLTGGRRAAPDSERSAGAPTMRMLTDVPAIDSIADRWNILNASVGNPVGCHSWASASAAARGAARPLAVVAVEQGQDLVALAPLARRPGPRARLELLGLHEIYEPTDFLYRDLDALEHLARALRQVRLPMFLWRIPAESPVVGALRGVLGERAVRTHPAMACPYIELDETWVEPEARFSSRRRSDFRRARRRAEALGTVAIEVVAPGPDEALGLFEEAVAVEAAGWKGEEGTAIARDEKKGRFYREWVRASAREGILRMSFLRIDGRAAAMQLAAESGNRFWLLKIGYDESFGRASPGQLLMLHTLAYAAARQLRSYEFLGSVAPWTEAWTHTVRDCIALRGYPRHWRSAPVILSDTVGLSRDRLRERFA